MLDLREVKIDHNSFFGLNGEWEFHWQKLLTPENYKLEKEKDPGIIVSVPSYWTSYEKDGESFPGMGYGSYYLKILLPEDIRSTLCFDIPIFDCAYRFYLNDRMIQSNGEVGTSREEEEPWYKPSAYFFIPQNDTLHLLLQVSNFHHRRGGFWKGIILGDEEKVMQRTEQREIFYFSTIGVLFFFSAFFLCFWFISREYIQMLYFALTSLGMVIRSSNSGLYMSQFFIDTSWSHQVKMEYFGTYMAFVFGILFLHQVFPRKYMKPVVVVNSTLFTLAGISLLILPVRIFAYELVVFQPIFVFLLLHYLVITGIGLYKGKIMDIIFFVTMALFIYTLVNDILLASTAKAIYHNYQTTISFQVFLFAMSVMIILQWVRNYKMRRRLESSLRFKNKVLSVIAHDLKNPVASLVQFFDLLATKPELATQEHMITALQASSEAAVDLLDNLLYWGRSQADQLIINPDHIPVEREIIEVESLFVHMAAQKEIQFRTEVQPHMTVYADRALLNIVLRNLISNAIKFTPRKGTVQVQAMEEGNMARFAVIDTGVGIKPEILEQFASNGSMGSSPGTDHEIGTGLGIQLVRELVEKSGGKLIIESETDKGSTFIVSLPQDKQKMNEDQ